MPDYVFHGYLWEAVAQFKRIRKCIWDVYNLVLTLVLNSLDADEIQKFAWGAMFWSRQGVRKKANFLCASWVFQRATRWYFPLPTTTRSKPAFTVGILGDIFLFKQQSQVTTGSLFMIIKKYTEGCQQKCIASQLWRSLDNLETFNQLES